MNRLIYFFLFLGLAVGMVLFSYNEVKAEGIPYTGLIVDATGVGLLPAMSPKIRDTEGNEVYGTLDVGCRIVEEFGVVHYANTLKEALDLEDLVGEHPMVVQAVGGGLDPWKANPMVAPFDAKRILEADQVNGFLKDLRVVFVI